MGTLALNIDERYSLLTMWWLGRLPCGWCDWQGI